MNESLTVSIHDLARGGAGVAKLENGEIVFVPFTAPGDEVRIRIVEKHKNYSQGELIEIIRPSSLRVAPPCSVFGICGGCAWQHLPYSLQFETKKKGVLHALKRAGLSTDHLEMDELPAKNPFLYRNRIQVRGIPAAKKLGFYARGSNEIVNIERCEISKEEINLALPGVKAEGFKNFQRDFKAEIDVEANGKVRVAWNQRHAAFGFRQVNDEQNEVLQQWVANGAGKGDVLLDLFGGYGNLSLGIRQHFREVHCVDSYIPKEAIAQAPEHFHYHRSEVLEWLEKTKTQTNPTDEVVAILDPPREGLGSTFSEIEQLLTSRFHPKRLLLVGCDVDSFARDTYRFTKRGYHLQKLGVLDLFPQTPHVESLALLTV